MFEDNRAKILPFYLILDVSGSMSGNRIAAANRIMPQIVDALAENPVLSDKIRFGMIDFGSDAQVRLTLCDPLDGSVQLPELTVRGSTSYSSAFTRLKSEITEDVGRLKAEGFAVHRPIAFFLSDGDPTESETTWKSAFAQLVSPEFPYRPNVIPCGVAEADPTTLRSLIHPAEGRKAMTMYLMDEGQDPARAIGAMAEVLISSMIQSSASVESEGGGFVLPAAEDLPDGISDDRDWVA